MLPCSWLCLCAQVLVAAVGFVVVVSVVAAVVAAAVVAR